MEQAKHIGIPVDINEIANRIHAECVKAGWWDDYPNKVHRYNTAMVLVCTEICESVEHYRRDTKSYQSPDKHLPHRRGAVVELADALIRLLDMGAALGVVFRTADILDDIRVFQKETADFEVAMASRGFRVEVNTMDFYAYALGVTTGAKSHRAGQSRIIQDSVAAVLYLALWLGENDLFTIVEEKFAYNQTRKDHKPENRAKEGGKKL